MRCGHCRQMAREDDSLRTIEITNYGLAQVCRECVARQQGRDPEPITYPAGSLIPVVGSGMAQRHISLCGTCRQAMRWGENQAHIRLRAGDSTGSVYVIAEGDCAGENEIEEGAYAVCQDCADIWKPAILRRLKADNVFPLTMEVRQVPRNGWL